MKSEIIKRLRQLEDKHGELRPVIVVEDAMQEDSPLHGEFNWNVDEAAMAHWIDRARAIIRQVRFEVVTKNIAPATVIAYVEDPDKPKGTQGYVSTIIARNDKDKAERILQVECERAEASLRRVYKVAESLNIKPSRVESILAQIRDIRGAA